MRQLLLLASRLIWLIAFCQIASVSARPSVESEPKASQEDPGERLYQDNCAKCHDNKSSGAPHRSSIGYLTPASIYDALTTGRMRTQAARLSDQERHQVAEFVSDDKLSDAQSRPLMMCKAKPGWFGSRKWSDGADGGMDPNNTRLVPAAQAGISAADLHNLRLRWAFAFPQVSRAVSEPLVTGGGLFVGSENGVVYALDAESGCVHWTFNAGAEVVGGIVSYANRVLIFGDRLARIYGISPDTGALIWQAKVEDHPSATIASAPALMGDRVYVPISSIEESAADPKEGCCTFRGSVVALNAATGDRVWKRYTIPDPPAERSKNALGVPQFGPSGAGVWVTPAVDRARGLIYVATGNNYSDPGDENSDAIFAIEAATGIVRWRTQTLQDVYNNWDFWCGSDPKTKTDPDCPSLKHRGPDIDINGSPILVHGSEQDILVVGRKDGTVFGVDPDSGKIRWTKRNSSNPDPYKGALWYGMMAEGRRVFVPSIGTSVPHVLAYVSDPDDGLFALDAFTGKQLWAARVVMHCETKAPCLGIATTPIGFPGVIFAGAVDGYVRAYDSSSGNVLWRFNTARQFTSTNGEIAKGGGIARNGIMIANGMLYVSSGFYQRSGNVLLAFFVDRKR